MHSKATVVFRVAGGASVGFGHLRRSWTLADRLTSESMAVYFISSSLDATTILAKADFHVALERSADVIDRTVECLRSLGSPVLCVVDDPQVTGDGLAMLKRYAPVVCIDDTGERRVPVDLVVNGSADAESLTYHGLSETCYLLGPRYMLLRPEFASSPARRVVSAEVARVLIMAGGGDAGRLLPDLVRVVGETLPQAAMDVVIGPFGSPLTIPASLQTRVTLYQSPPSVRSLMLKADLAVSAGGQTLYELAASSTPTLGVRVASNQAYNLRGLSRYSCLKDLGATDEAGFWDRLRGELLELDGNPKARRDMGEAGRSVVDGLGTERVSKALKTLMAESTRVGDATTV